MSGVIAVVLIVAVVGAQALVLSRLPRAEPAVPARRSPPGRVAAPVGRDPVSRLVDVLGRRTWARRGLSVLSLVALGAAVAMIGYPFYTNVLQGRIQERLDRQFASPEIREAYVAGRVEEGDSLTRLRIPSLDVDVVVVEGTTPTSLRAGAGHYSNTPLPCEDGNVAIAGHRTTYGRPFNHVDLLKPGDLIILEVPIGSCTYRVTKAPFIVVPHDLSVVANTPGQAQLTLTTCHPKGSARQRLIVQAELVSGSVPDAGAAES